MYCKNCGCEIKENQKFCPKCGAKVINEIKINAKNTKKKIQIILACICCFTVIIGATIGGFVWYKNNTSHISESDENYIYFDSGFSNVKITDVDSALEAISDVKDALGIGNVRKELNVQSVNTVDDNTYYRFQQYYEDIPVYGKSIVVFADSKGKALGLTANTITYKEPTNQKDRTDKEYIEKAQKAINYDKIIFNSIQDKAYLISDDRLILCCPVELTYTYDNQIFSKIFFVSSNNLDIEKEIDLIDNNISASKISGMQKTYDNIELSGNKIDNNYCLTDDERKIICCTMSDNDDIVSENIADTSDKECVDAYVNMQYVYNYFNRVLSIDSFDNNGSGILLFVSKNGYLYDQAKSALIDTLEKAESIGSKDYLNYAAIIMGEPNELFKNSPVNSIDIIAHEYTHRIVGNIVKLENGGIDEGISDIFGNLAELDSGASNDVWKLGENSGHSKYDMKDKITMNSYNHEDEGHDNAAIIAHAAYLMWNGNNDSDIFKIDTDKLAKLWYRSLYLLHSDATFNQCANSVMLVAKSMQDTGELTAAQIACVRRSFESVGIYPDNYLSKSATNGAVVHVKDIKNDNLPSYYLKVTDNKSNVIIDNEFTDENPYVVNVPDNGIYKFSVKQSKDSAVEYVTKVRILNINRENSELNLQTGLDLEENNTDSSTEQTSKICFGNVVSYNDCLYYWKYNSDSFSKEEATFAYYNNNEEAQNQLICRTTDGKENVILTANGFSNIAIVNDVIYYQCAKGPRHFSVKSCTIDGDSIQNICEGQLCGVIDNGKYVIYRENSGSNIYSIDTSTNTFTTISNYDFLICSNNSVICTNKKDSEKISEQDISVYKINGDGSKKEELYLNKSIDLDSIKSIYENDYYEDGYLTVSLPYIKDNNLYFIFQHIAGSGHVTQSSRAMCVNIETGLSAKLETTYYEDSGILQNGSVNDSDYQKFIEDYYNKKVLNNSDYADFSNLELGEYGVEGSGALMPKFCETVDNRQYILLTYGDFVSWNGWRQTYQFQKCALYEKNLSSGKVIKLYDTNNNGNVNPYISKNIPENSFNWGKHHYAIYDECAETWQEAQEYCEALGGHLAIISSQEENGALFSYMKSQNYESAYFGLSDHVEENTWCWVNEEQVEYTNWHLNEPNSENSNEDYAMFYYKYSDGTWNDGDFNESTVNGGKTFICEWD